MSYKPRIFRLFGSMLKSSAGADQYRFYVKESKNVENVLLKTLYVAIITTH